MLIYRSPVSVGTEETLELIESLFGSIDKLVEPPRAVPSLAEWDFPQELTLRDEIPPVEASALLFELPTAAADDHDAINFNDFTHFRNRRI